MTKSFKKLYEEAKRENAHLRKLLDASDNELIQEIARTRTVVDLGGIARHMKVNRYTPQQWKQRGHLPPVDFPEIKEPLWYASTIRDQFAEPTRRVWYDDPDEEPTPDEELSPVA